MRGIISITRRLRARAVALRSGETRSDLLTAGQSCCRTCMTDVTARSILCSIRDSGRCWERPRCWLYLQQQRGGGKELGRSPDGSTHTLQGAVNPAIAAVLARYPLPNTPPGPYGARTYAAPSNVNTDTDQFSIRIDKKVGAKGTF